MAHIGKQLSLREVGKYVPQDTKQLAACVNCKIIMQESQWAKLQDRCPNCEQRVETTQDFVGMISTMMPRESWVAKWNKIQTCISGVYAINVTQLNEDDDAEQEHFQRAQGATGRRSIEFEDDGLGDFIADDDEAF